VFDALALKANLDRVETFIHSKSGGSYGTVTGTTAETVLLSINIAGGEFVEGDVMSFIVSYNKSVSTGSSQLRVRVGTTGTTSDAQIAIGVGYSSTAITAMLERKRMQFLSGNILGGSRNSAAFATDVEAFQSYTSTSLNYANDWKLTFTMTHTVSTDSSTLNFYRIGKTKTF
jgi:hypothetical protein